MVLQLDEATAEGLLFSFNAVAKNAQSPQGFFQKDAIDFATYQKAFNKVRSHLQFGNSYLVNLTLPTPIHTSFSLAEIYQYAHAPFKLYVPQMFTVFSPEMFVKISDGRIMSSPMKGTIDARVHNAAHQLLTDKKELAEHITIVDLIRNDLSMIAKDVQVSNFRYISEVLGNDKHLLQVSSDIVGNLPSDYHKNIGNLIFTLLPAGSISGAPKEKTMQIIAEAENYERGFYTGIFGYFDGTNLISAVMIRFIEHTSGGLIFKSGGGITLDSIAQNEYNELIDKVYLPFRFDEITFKKM